MDANPDPGLPLAVQLILLLLLIFLDAYFVMAETALVSVNKNNISALAQQEDRRAKIVEKLIDEPNRFLSAVQILVTFAGFLVSAAAAVSIADDLKSLLSGAGWHYAGQIAIVMVTIILCYVMLVFGILYPKKVALQHAESIAMFTGGSVAFLSALNRPFSWFLSVSVNFVLKVTGQKVDVESEEFSEEEIMSMLENGQESGALKEEGKKMIGSIFAFDDKLAYEVMTPRTDVFAVNINDPTSEYIDELMELRYSRIPVYDDDSDNIIGIIHIKDYLIKAREEGFENVDITDILRKPFFVPETKNIDTLFFELQKTKQHIAILIDEYGGFSGIVTMEDIIEEVMGEIDDEYDQEEPKIQQIDENTWRIDGPVDLDDINEELGTELLSDNSETIGGFLIELLGEIPEDSEKEQEPLEYKNYVFTIESVKDRRIEKIKMHILPEPEENEEESNGNDDESSVLHSGM